MACYLTKLEVEHFRGINGMSVEKLNHINLIVGDNNCGKTSVLEAVQLLRSPGDFTNVLRVARQRNQYAVISNFPVYEGFSSLFPQPSVEPVLQVSAVSGKLPVSVGMKGKWTAILLEPSELPRFSSPFSKPRMEKSAVEASAFSGELYWEDGSGFGRKDVLFHEYSHISGLELKKSSFLDINYLSPIDHLRMSVLNGILKNAQYKDLCLDVLRLFDPDIEDCLLLKNDRTNRPVEYIRHKRLGTMPLLSYGDGIRKVLLLASAIARSVHSVLLIDEIDTGLHAKYYDPVFRFVVSACRRYAIQLFITTHSKEAIDALLSTQDYDTRNADDELSVLTLKKTPDRTLVREMDGRSVYQDREAFDFEVRL